MRNKQRLLIMFLLIVMLFLYIVNNGHGLLYNHVIALEDEISFVAALIVLILSIPKAVDTFAKQSKIVKSISFISKVFADNFNDSISERFCSPKEINECIGY